MTSSLCPSGPNSHAPELCILGPVVLWSPWGTQRLQPELQCPGCLGRNAQTERVRTGRHVEARELLRAEASGAREAERRHGENGEAEDVGVDSLEHWLGLDGDSTGDGQGRRTGDGLASRPEPPPPGLAQGLTPFPRLFYRRTQGTASLPGVEDPLDLVAGQSGQKGSLLCCGTAGLAPLRRDALKA